MHKTQQHKAQENYADKLYFNLRLLIKFAKARPEITKVSTMANIQQQIYYQAHLQKCRSRGKQWCLTAYLLRILDKQK